MKSLEINNSQMAEFRECPYRWGLKYVERLVPEGSGVDSRGWGHCYHAGQHALWTTRGTLAERVAAARDAARRLYVESAGDEVDMDEIAALDWVFGHYAERMKVQLESWVVLGAELRYSVKMRRGLSNYGTIDLVVYDPAARALIVIDHKSTSGDVMAFEHKLQLDTQSCGYVNAVRALVASGALKVPGPLDEDICRFEWHVMRSRRPSTPDLNLLTKKAATTPELQAALDLQTQDGVPRGEVSVKQIDTLFEVYLEAIEDQAQRGLAPTEKQRDLCHRLKQRGDSFFARTEHYLSPQQIIRWRGEFIIEAGRIGEALRLPMLRTRNPGACSHAWSRPCEYRDACIQPEAKEFGFVVAPAEAPLPGTLRG